MMIELLQTLIEKKRLMLIGFGMEGKSTYNYISKMGICSDISISDINPQANIPGCTFYSGADYLDYIDGHDIAFKSPGVVLPKDYRDYKCTITSQTEVFLQFYGKQVIGITGTKGKSTVASLLLHVLSENNIPSVLAGNIGKPVFDVIADIHGDTNVILELSSHQLEICNYSPAVSLLLNIYEDHLDHYGTFDKYVRAKKNIYLHQRPTDILYCSRHVKPSNDEAASEVVVVDSNILPFTSLESIDNVRLRGKHNLDNCAFVYSVAKTFGIADKDFIAALQSYVPLRHRLEFIGTKDGVDYYDDSISTTVESTVNAVESIRNVSTILLGGMDRGIDYTALIKYISGSNLSNVICMYESGKRIYDLLKKCGLPGMNITYCDDLDAATETAKRITAPETACILSPASASYGSFKNFEERGNAFKQKIFS